MAIKLPAVSSIQLSGWQHKALRWGGWFLFGFFCLVFCLQMTFPYDRVKDKLAEALASRYDVTIGSVQRGFFPGQVFFKHVTLRGRPTADDENPGSLSFDRFEVNVDLLGSFLHWEARADFEALAGSGSLSGDVEISEAPHLVAELDDMPASSVPGLGDMVGLPMTGKVNGDLDITFASDLRKLEGKVALSCTACTIGDGESKLKLKLRAGHRGAAFAEKGVTIDRMLVEKLELGVKIDRGKLELTKWNLVSSDLEAEVELEAQMARTLAESSVKGCLRFKPLEPLATRAPNTHSALLTTGAPLGGDGFYHIRLEGPLGEMKKRALECGPGSGGGGDDVAAGGRTRNRPQLTAPAARVETDAAMPKMPDDVRPLEEAGVAPPPQPSHQPANATLSGGSPASPTHTPPGDVTAGTIGAGTTNPNHGAPVPGTTNTTMPPPPTPAPADPQYPQNPEPSAPSDQGSPGGNVDPQTP